MGVQAVADHERPRSASATAADVQATNSASIAAPSHASSRALSILALPRRPCEQRSLPDPNDPAACEHRKRRPTGRPLHAVAGVVDDDDVEGCERLCAKAKRPTEAPRKAPRRGLATARVTPEPHRAVRHLPAWHG